MLMVYRFFFVKKMINSLLSNEKSRNFAAEKRMSK